jgi:integrase
MTKKNIPQTSSRNKKNSTLPPYVRERQIKLADGSVTTQWYVRRDVVINGQRRTFDRQCERSRTDAKDVLSQINRAIDEEKRGGRPPVLPGVRHTFGELADYCERDVYIPEIIENDVVVQEGYANADTPKYYIGRKFFADERDRKPMDSASWRKLIGENTYLDQITKKQLTKLRTDLFMVHRAYKGTEHERMRSVTDVNRRFEVLRHMFAVAIKDIDVKNPWMISNPASGLVKGSEEVPRNQLLEYEDEPALLAVCDGPRRHLRLIILGLLETCMREGEFYQLKVRCWKQQVLKVERLTSKVRRERSIGVTGELAKEIDAWVKLHRLTDDDFMFPLRTIRLSDNRERGPKKYDNDRLKNASNSFNTAKRLTGIERLQKLTLRDLRRTGATRLYVDAGVELLDISRLLGHKDIEMTKRYIGLDTKVDTQRQRANAELVLKKKKEALRKLRKAKFRVVN